ncbi:MAG: TetR/AcrR family transcriptional regulator [Candidatus Glassbacteria bacterium]|nr:TetR/AcrR family transcriptional regulator [Candidatus Glassbacteria bacterium]
MPRITEKRRQLLERFIRGQIEEAVAGIIGTEGVQGLTMDKIAARAGVAKGTLYRYFSSKSALLRDTVDHCLGRMIEELSAILDGGLPPQERLCGMILHHLRFFEDHRDLFRVLLYERNLSQSTAARQGSSKYQAFLRKVAGVIEEGTRSGVFREVPSLKAAAMMIETDIASIGQRLLSAHPQPVEEDARNLSDLFFSGISNRV